MATSTGNLCDICKGQNITKTAEDWCPECEEGLCSECRKHHDVSKFTRNHQVISAENYNKLPKHISTIVQHCNEHDRMFQNYCSHHQCLCCPACIASTHNKCELLDLNDIIKTAKSSSLLESIEENIEKLKTNLKLLIEEQARNLATNQQKKKQFIQEVKQIRSTMNAHLDKLENQILQELSAAESQIQRDVGNLTAELKKKLQTVTELEADLMAVKQYASDLQVCLGSMTFKTRVEKENMCLQSLQESGRLKERILNLNINDQVKDVAGAIKTFGSVTLQELASTIKLKTEDKKQAQILYQQQPSTFRGIDEIKLTLKSKLTVPTGTRTNNITGCAVTPDGNLMLIDRLNNRLVRLNEKGVLQKENILYLRPTSVTLVNNQTICVSFLDARLELMDINTYVTKEVIRTSNNCTGVTSDGQNLFWYERSKGIQMKQLSNDTITTVVEDKSENIWSHLAVHADKIYQAHCTDTTITCYNTNGEKLWEFKDTKVFPFPTGITVDKDSNVYVGSRGKVSVLSPDGQKCRQLLGPRDGLSTYPYLNTSIYLDKIKNVLLVVESNGSSFIYKMS